MKGVAAVTPLGNAYRGSIVRLAVSSIFVGFAIKSDLVRSTPRSEHASFALGLLAARAEVIEVQRITLDVLLRRHVP